MKLSHRLILLSVLASATAVAAAGSASASIYSSGDIDKKVADLGRTVSTIKVRKDAEITDIDVNVRLSHSANEDLLIGLLGPGHEFEELVSQGQAGGENFGSGKKSCGGTFTTFDDDAGGPLSGGSSPYAASFQPSENLNGEFAGDPARYRWKLYVFDLNQSDSGTLHCWQLNILTS
jgi:subtilisin-like proprotein convertase family protein